MCLQTMVGVHHMRTTAKFWETMEDTEKQWWQNGGLKTAWPPKVRSRSRAQQQLRMLKIMHKCGHVLYKETQTHRNTSGLLQRSAWEEGKSEDGQWGGGKHTGPEKVNIYRYTDITAEDEPCTVQQ